MRQVRQSFFMSRRAISQLVFPSSFFLFSAVSLPAMGADTAGWEEIPIGGDAMCSDGSPFSIFVHRGGSGKLVFDFMGGGACWDAATCNAVNATYSKKVPDVIGKWLPEADGIYNRNRSENQFRDDTHVMIPYCTGDVHWGSADHVYTTNASISDGSKNSPKTMIHHRGAVNAQAAIDHTLSQIITNPSRIFVTGCSAGAYGAIWWTPYIRRQSPWAQIIQFSDSGAGILTPEFRHTGFKNWEVERSLPRWIPTLDLDAVAVLDLTMPQLYSAISSVNPTIRFSQFNALNDIVQRFFYKSMGGDQHEWSGRLRQEMLTSRATSLNFSYYISPWDSHCIIPYADFYGESKSELQGQTFPSWLNSVLYSPLPISEPCIGCAEEKTN